MFLYCLDRKHRISVEEVPHLRSTCACLLRDRSAFHNPYAYVRSTMGQTCVGCLGELAPQINAIIDPMAEHRSKPNVTCLFF